MPHNILKHMILSHLKYEHCIKLIVASKITFKSWRKSINNYLFMSFDPFLTLGTVRFKRFLKKVCSQSPSGEDTIRVMAIWRGYWEACILQIVSVVVRTEVSRTAQALGRTCSSFWGGQWFLLSKTSFHVLFSLSLEVFPSQLFTVGRRHKEQRKTSTPRLAGPALLKDPILW